MNKRPEPASMDEAAPMGAASLPTGVAPLRQDHPNPLMRALPVRWEVEKSPALLEAERNLEELRAEEAGWAERYAVAKDRGDAASMVEARVREDLLPDLLTAAAIVHLRERIAWLREARELIDPWAQRSQARVEALQAERERIDEAITEAQFVGAELQGAMVALLVEVGDLGRRLQSHSPQRPVMPGWRKNSKPMLVTS